MNEKHDADSGPSQAANLRDETAMWQLMIELLRLINEKNNRHELLRAVTALLHEWTGCEAVGIRMREGEDFPYFETRGFPPEFVSAENRLCEVNSRGELARDTGGNPILECMCGDIIRGRFDPTKPFFTAGGSFWTNSTSDLLASTTEADRLGRTRNRCNGEGYESVALIPLRSSGETFGLLQLNDRRRDRFTPRMISLLEGLAGNVAHGLAHRKAEESLREGAERLERAVQAGNVGPWDWDLRTNRVFFSPEWKRQMGYEDHEISNDFSEWQNRVHPEDLDRCLRQVRAFIAKPWPDYRIEFRFRHKDGSYRWILAQASLAYDEQGKAVRMLGSHIDITEHKRLQNAVVQRERQLHSFFTGATAGLAVLDKELRYREINETLAAMNGIPAEQHLGRTVREIIPALARILEPVLQQVLVTGEPVLNFELAGQTRAPSGFLRHWVLSYFPMLGADGILEGVGTIVVEITERKQAEEALRESEERFRVTFDQSPIGAAVVALDYRFVRVNEMLCRITGYSSAELTRLGFPDITHPDDLAADVEHAQRLVAGEIDHYEADERCLRKDGRVIWIHLVVRLVKTVSGQPLYFLPMIQDITERKLAEERFREAEKLAAAGRMAALVAHEINNPLAGIKNSFRLIRDAVPEDHPDRDMVGRIEREIDRIARIVRQMYHIYSPRVEKLCDIPVNETVRDVLAMLEPLCREYEVAIELGAISPDLTVRAHPGSLQQVFFNLTANAIQASPRRAGVSITAELANEDYVKISICDRGPGIPAEVRDRMFEPFVSADAGDTPKQGLGLGLAVVKSIVDSLGGRIEFETTLGEGTCFHVYLPLR